jgi:PAT family beta-lactamase induction signal transducer AmpG
MGKILKGFSGATVENLSVSHGLVHAYGIFFIGCGLIGIPAIILFAVLELWHKRSRLAPARA